MSKTWYPVIDYEKCTECGTCTAKCKHGVYDKGKAPRPVVVFPERCIEGCTGCGSICPNGAIEYFGDREHSVVVYGGGCGGSGGENRGGAVYGSHDKGCGSGRASCGSGCGCKQQSSCRKDN